MIAIAQHQCAEVAMFDGFNVLRRLIHVGVAEMAVFRDDENSQAVAFIEQKGLDRLRRMPKPQMRFIFDERGVTFDSDLGTSTMSWLSVENIWEFPEAWLLMFGEQRFLTVPCSILTEEVKTMIKTKVSKKDSPNQPAHTTA